MNRIKTSKKQIRAILAYDWWVYVLLIVGLGIGCYYGFTAKHALKDYEQLQLFIGCEVSDDSIINDLKEATKDTSILKINCVEAEENDSYFGVRLETSGYGASDILILSGSFLNNQNVFEVARHSLFIDGDYERHLNGQFPSLQFKDYEGDKYAFKIHDKIDESYNDLFDFSWLKSDDDLYMCLVRDSANLGIYGHNSMDEHDGAVKTVDYLLRRGK